MLKHCFLLLACLFSPPVLSGEVIKSTVSHDHGIYHAAVEMQIEADTDKVYALFTDFNYLSRLNDNITNSVLIEEAPPEYTVLVETHNCVLFFCIDLTQLQKVTELDEGYILVEDIKGESDFAFANSRWRVYAHGSGTRVSFSSEMKPDFWLPPLFGPWLFKNQLSEETQTMIEQLEQLATHEH